MKDILFQIIHADLIKLWKTPDHDTPCFWIASTIASSSANARNDKTRALFYRFYWDNYADTLEKFANALAPVSK